MKSVKKVAFVGTHGVGKTTLINEIRANRADRQDEDMRIVSETAARVFEMGKHNPALVINQGATLEAQLHIIGLQIQDEKEKEKSISESNRSKRIVLCDRTLLDAVIYTYHRIVREPSTYPWARLLPRYLYEWVSSAISRPYDIVFYLPIAFPLKATDIRPGDIEFQERIDDLMQGMFIGKTFDGGPLDDFNQLAKKVIVLSGELPDRVTKANRYIDALFASE
jgi:hypothetical protein